MISAWIPVMAAAFFFFFVNSDLEAIIPRSANTAKNKETGRKTEKEQLFLNRLKFLNQYNFVVISEDSER